MLLHEPASKHSDLKCASYPFAVFHLTVGPLFDGLLRIVKQSLVDLPSQVQEVEPLVLAGSSDVARMHGDVVLTFEDGLTTLYSSALLRQNEPSVALLPVSISRSSEPAITTADQSDEARAAGAIHIEIPGGATISVEHGANAVLLRSNCHRGRGYGWQRLC